MPDIQSAADSRDPGLLNLIQLVIDQMLDDTHTVLPGRVVNLNLSGGKVKSVDVQVELKIERRGKAVLRAPIVSVPILFPRAGGFFVSLPVAIGDKVIVVFSERSVDEWIANGAGPGKEVLPRFGRKHSLNDGFAFPAFTFAQAPFIHSENLVIGKEGGSQIHITPAGDIRIGSETSSQPVPLGFKLLSWLSKAVILTPMGPAKIDPASLSTFQADVLSAKVKAE